MKKIEEIYKPQDICSRIRLTARIRKLKIGSMLDECGLSENTLSNMNNGSSIASDSLARMADCLDCSVDYLLGRTDNPSLITDVYIGGDNNGVQAVKNGEVAIHHTSTDTFTQQLLELVDELSLVQKAEVIMMISKMKSRE